MTVDAKEGRAKEDGRREQLLSVTRRQIIELGSLNVSLNDIADEVGVSRSLIYVYFDSVAQIIDALFAEEMAFFDQYIEEFLHDDSPIRERMVRLFAAYLDRLTSNGQLGYLVLRERNQDNPLGEANSRHFRRLLRSLSLGVMQALSLSARETFVLLELLGAIPESLARMVRKGNLEIKTAHETNATLVGAALDYFAVKDG